MSGSASTTTPTTPVAGTPYVPMTKSVVIGKQTVEISTLPPNSQIEDGQHFLSANGNHCYKVPRKHYQVAVKYVNAAAVLALSTFTSEQLNQVLIWTRDRLADKGRDNTTYLIVPVSKEKQKTALSMYMKGLWALRKGAQNELAKRDGEFFTPQAKVATPAAEAAAPVEEVLDSAVQGEPASEESGDPLDSLDGI